LLTNKTSKLFIILGAFFITNAIIAEFIGIKIFSLERSFGITPVGFNFFGEEDLSFNLSVGVLLWPIVFVMTDVINEYYGKKGVQMLSFMAVGLISYAFLVVLAAIYLIPADFWPGSYSAKGVPDMQAAFKAIFGQGLWIIVGSLVAFMIGQLVDVYVFLAVKKYTGEKMVWLRATGSTFISQLLDSFVVLFIAFYIGAGWKLELVLAIGIVNYLYKFLLAIVLTPLIYLAHFIIDRYLGKETAEKLKQQALANR